MADILLHVGYGKSGSSYLQDWFLKHPELFMGDGWDLCKTTYSDVKNNLVKEDNVKYFVKIMH